MIGNVAAIDSAVMPAVAYYQRGRLVNAVFTRTPSGAGLEVVVVERPEFRGVVDMPKVPSLFKMACGGYLAAGYAMAGGKAKLVEYTPRDWKGEEPKPANHARLWMVLDEKERRVLGGKATAVAIEMACEKGALRRWKGSGDDLYPASFKTHNLLDAAAMGATYLGRLPKAGA